MKLVQFCNDLLNIAELKITQLKETHKAVEEQTGFDEFDDDSEEDFEE
jgi:hypothetical protein